MEAMLDGFRGSTRMPAPQAGVVRPRENYRSRETQSTAVRPSMLVRFFSAW